MTRKENSIVESSYEQCPCCQLTRFIGTKGTPRHLHTIEEILGSDDDLVITEDRFGRQKTHTVMDNNKFLDSNVLRNTESKEDLVPVEITHKPEKQNTGDVVKTSEDSEYVSLNLHILKRAQSEGKINDERQKLNCYFGRKTGDGNRVVLQRAKSAEVHRTRGIHDLQDPSGISEIPVFFSSIGEWTIVDLNRKVYEKEDAQRTFYLRRKKASYKEIEPESACRIL